MAQSAEEEVGVVGLVHVFEVSSTLSADHT